MTRNYESTIAQLNKARTNCLTEIDALKAASAKDGADRSNSIASITRDLASFDRQLAEIAAKQEAEKPKQPETPVQTEIPQESKPT